MAGVIHIAEVAAILTAAYILGWAIGYLAHRLLARAPAIAAVPSERIAAVTSPPDPDALVKAPVIDPVPSSPPPVARSTVAVPDPVLAAIADYSVPQPATPIVREPEPELPGLTPVAIPITAPPPPLIIEPLPPRRAPRVEPEPPPPPEPEVVLTAAPALRPGEAWSGEVRGRAPEPIARPVSPPVETTVDPFEAPPADVPLVLDLGLVGHDSTYGEPVLPPTGPEITLPEEPVVAEPLAPAAVVPEPAPAPPQLEEDSAMRAIEGGWSRVQARPLPGSPELSDVGVAVAAAQSAVEQLLAQSAIDAPSSDTTQRPKGLPRPRLGKSDDLKRISGLGALDESTLNNLGVYHFDQIAGWSEAQVLWMEDHVFARGRIGHENWQQQARDLAATVAG